jgi:hypothetical protein
LPKLIIFKKNTKSFQKRFEKINKEKNFIKNAEKNIFQQKILIIKLKRDTIKINKNQKIVKL